MKPNSFLLLRTTSDTRKTRPWDRDTASNNGETRPETRTETRPPKGRCTASNTGETRRQTRETRPPKGGHSIQHKGHMKGGKEDKASKGRPQHPIKGNNTRRGDEGDKVRRRHATKGSKKGDTAPVRRTQHPTKGNQKRDKNGDAKGDKKADTASGTRTHEPRKGKKGDKASDTTSNKVKKEGGQEGREGRQRLWKKRQHSFQQRETRREGRQGLGKADTGMQQRAGKGKRRKQERKQER